jgi:hypothetical protein
MRVLLERVAEEDIIDERYNRSSSNTLSAVVATCSECKQYLVGVLRFKPMAQNIHPFVINEIHFIGIKDIVKIWWKSKCRYTLKVKVRKMFCRSNA